MMIRRISVLLLAALLFGLLSAGLAFAEEPTALNNVEAATVDELLKAIAPNTVITLTARSYDLTEARGYGVYGSQYYGWREVYDSGWELEIEDVENLTIRASLPGTELITVPRYACVLKFINCANVTLEGFTAGHSEGPGYCTGAVLRMENCRDMRVQNCDLYGCGTYGLELDHCRGIHTTDTVIRDCSYGALYASNCADVLLDGCSLRDIEGYGGLLTMSACHDCALINSTVRGCSTPCLTDFYTVKDFTLAGCELVGNNFESIFFSVPYPVILDGCVFRNDNSESWYRDEWQESERAVDPAGRTYSDEELDALTLSTDVQWSAPELPELPAAPSVSEDGMIHVKTVDELLASIAPNVSIYLEDGVYDLSTATGYGYYDGTYYSWMSCYDGPGLVIRNAENLRVTAAGPHRARIVAAPRYCEVLSFENCSNVTLGGFTAGHTQLIEENACAGGVLCLTNCRDFLVEDCSLYGCGIVGLSCYNCRDVELRTTEIHDCSDGGVCLFDSRNVALNACNIHDVPNYNYMIYNCKSISADGSALPEGTSW